jgi:hypothetical protein
MISVNALSFAILGIVLSSKSLAADKPSNFNAKSQKTLTSNVRGRSPASSEGSSRKWLEKFPLSQLRIRWTDSAGKTVKPPLAAKIENIWKREGRFERPYFKLTLNIPNKYLWEVTTPHIETTKMGSELSVVMDPTLGTLSFKGLTDKGVAQNYSLAIVAKSKDGIYVAHPSCSENDIEVELMQETRMEFLWASAYCQDRGDHVEVSFYKPKNKPDLKLRVTNSAQTPYSTPGWSSYKFKKDLVDKDTSALGYLTFENVDSSQSHNQISYSPKSKRRDSWGIFPGIGVTYVSYSEPRQDIALTQMSLTARVNGFIRLRPDWLRVEGDGLIDAAPFTISSGATAAARIMNGSLRVGAQLPKSLLKMKWTVMAGGYLTKMLVSNGVFGLELMSGSQIMIRANSDPKMFNKTFYVQFGFNTIADETSMFSLSNGGILLSAGYELMNWQKHPLDLIFHFSSTSYISSDLFNEMHMMSTYGGIQIGF